MLLSCSWDNAAPCGQGTNILLVIRHKDSPGTFIEPVQVPLDDIKATFSIPELLIRELALQQGTDWEVLVRCDAADAEDEDVDGAVGSSPRPHVPDVVLCTLFISDADAGRLRQQRAELERQLAAMERKIAHADQAATAAQATLQELASRLQTQQAQLGDINDVIGYNGECGRLQAKHLECTAQWNGAPANVSRHPADNTRQLLLQPRHNNAPNAAPLADFNRIMYKMGVLAKAAMEPAGQPGCLGPGCMLGAVERDDVNRAICKVAGNGLQYFVAESYDGLAHGHAVFKADKHTRMLNLANPDIFS